MSEGIDRLSKAEHSMGTARNGIEVLRQGIETFCEQRKGRESLVKAMAS